MMNYDPENWVDYMKLDLNYDHKQYLAHYYKASVKFKLLYYLKNREFALMIPKNFPYQERSTRLLRVGRIKDVDINYEVTGMKSKKTLYNFYMSVATYDGGIPFTPYNIEKRRELKARWKTEHLSLMTSYDFFLDIDGTFNVFDYTRSSALDIKNRLDELNCPHFIRFSGKGYHFVIPYRYFADVEDAWLRSAMSFDHREARNIYWLFSRIAMYLSENITEMVDQSVYDSRRVMKVPFSLSLYEKDFYVCLPINSRKELKSNDLKHYSFSRWLDQDFRYFPDELHNPDGNVTDLLRCVMKAGLLKINEVKPDGSIEKTNRDNDERGHTNRRGDREDG